MRALLQRVHEASVTVDGEIVGAIGPGLLVLLGVTHEDTEVEARWLANKLVGLRIFEDDDGKMNRSVLDRGGAVLVVSQFTLYGDARKGNRPSFMQAARPEHAEPLCDAVVAAIDAQGIPVETGRFRTDMKVELLNDGPVTIVIDL